MEGQVINAAKSFGNDSVLVESLTEGLIHKTYKIVSADGRAIILQQVNTLVFTDPEKIIENYQLLYHHSNRSNGIKIPVPIKTSEGNGLYIEGEFCWRAFEYIPDSYTENLPTTQEKIFSAAQCYGAFVRDLFGLDTTKLTPTIPGFHDLRNRYIQFQKSTRECKPLRMMQSLELISKIETREYLVDFYNYLIQDSRYKIRAMHHDCKLSNILFDKHTKQAICPIDLDTTMPGYFFSDVGDMVRSMVSGAEEKTATENITIRKGFYEAILAGYQSGIGDAFTETEQAHIHHAGLLMIYMQGIRFLTDYLSNDVYYKTSYPEQNFDRASNQLALLEKLEEFLRREYNLGLGQ